MFRFVKNATVIVTIANYGCYRQYSCINITYLRIKKIKLTTGFKITMFTCVNLTVRYFKVKSSRAVYAQLALT